MEDVLGGRAESANTRSVAALRPLFVAASELGVDVGALLRRFDVDPLILENGLARIDGPLSTRIALALGAECRGMPLAIHCARHVHFGALGIFDQILSSAQTMREAAALGSQFFALLDGSFELVLTEEGRLGYYTLVERNEPLAAPLLAELTMVTITSGIWSLVGVHNPSAEIRFVHACTSDPRAYEEHFKCPVRFGAEKNEIVFPRFLLEQHIRTGNPEARDALTRCASQMMKTQAPALSFVERVRRLAEAALSEGDGSLAVVAERLGTSARTLQRRLKNAGTSYAEILDDARRELATSHVASGAMPVATIAESLGFADASTFARAFRRWTTMSPTDYRASRREVA